jgi:PAS domain S-box-containing protein
VQEMVVSKMLLELISMSNGVTLGEDEAARNFTRLVSDYFGIDRAEIISVYNGDYQRGALLDYVLNTRKTYVDNQLSEFSSFPELIGYKNSGYKSCAVMPMLAGGKSVAVLELLSKSENKFGDELINSVAFGASFMGFVLVYRYESSKSARLANYFEGAFNSPIPQFLVSGNGSIVKANKSALREFGYESQRSDIKSVLNTDPKQLAAGSVKVSLSAHDSMRVYSVAASPISEKLMHISVQDVTELEKFRTILELMGESAYSGVICMDDNMAITDVTENIEKVIGYQGALIVGKTITDLVPEGERPALKKELELKEGGRASGSFSLMSSGSAPVCIRYVASRLSGRYVLLFANAQAEQYVNDMRSALADFIDNTSDMVMMVDSLGYIKSSNMPAESVLGYPRDQLVGKEIRALYSDSSVLDRDMNYVREGGKVDNSYADFVVKDGSLVPATHSVRAFRDVDGNSGYVIVAKELATKRKLMDQEAVIKGLNGEVVRLKSTGDLKSQFIYNISHELKTPLTNINGFSKLLYEGEFGMLNNEQKEYVSTVIEEVDRLMIIIQQILDAVKLDSNKIKLDTKEVDMKELEGNPSIKALQDSATNKGLSFSWRVDYDVPKIIADPNRLIQAFVNLIGNAIKFTEKGGVEVRIRKKSNRQIECSVTDTGIGISDEDRRQLFRKFYQAPKKGLVKQEQAGTGLGLSITKDIITLHGGKIGFDSQVGKGSRFWFTIPTSPRKKKQAPV